MYEVIVIGAGPAGLSASLILGRCLRKVLLIDNGKPRNRYSDALHGYLTRDGVPPQDFLKFAREELAPYTTVEIKDGEAIEARKTEVGFAIRLVTGETYACRRLLIATGVVDNIPDLPHIMDFYGTSIHTCPYCDAFEVRGRPLAVFGNEERGRKLALSLLQWSPDITLITNGPADFSKDEREDFNKRKINVVEKKIADLVGENGKLKTIVFEDGSVLERETMFFNTSSFIKSKLLEQLECNFDHQNGVPTGKYESTNVPGLFVAGNICREVQLVIVAAGEGAEAAFGINTSLCKEDTSIC